MDFYCVYLNDQLENISIRAKNDRRNSGTVLFCKSGYGFISAY